MWEDSHQETFEILQQALVCAPVLAYPDSRDMFTPDTHASDTVIRAVLIQIQEGGEAESTW